MNKAEGIKLRAGERGAVSIQTLLIFVVVAAAAFAIIQIVPVYSEQRQIIYKVDDLANKAAVRNSKGEDIKKGIERIMQEHDLPPGSITLGAYGQDRTQIIVGYTRSINFLVATYDWRVDYTANGKAL